MTLTALSSVNESSPLVDWDARWKLVSLFLFSLVVATLTQLAPLLVSLGFAFALALYARVAWGSVADRLSLILLGILPFAILMPLTVPNGWQLVLPISVRGLTIGLVALVLIDTTPMTRLFEALHALGVPDRLVWVMQLAYRYTFVLFAEVRRIRIAARTRGFRIRTGHAHLSHARSDGRRDFRSWWRSSGASRRCDAMPRLRRSNSHAHAVPHTPA